MAPQSKLLLALCFLVLLMAGDISCRRSRSRSRRRSRSKKEPSVRKRSKLRQTRKYGNRAKPKKDKAADEEKESDKAKADTGVDPAEKPETQPVETSKEPENEVQKTSSEEIVKEEKPDQTEQADPNPVASEDVIVEQDETVKEEEPQVQDSKPKETIQKPETEAKVENETQPEDQDDTQPEEEDDSPQEEEINPTELPETTEPEEQSEISEELNPPTEKNTPNQPSWGQKLESLMDYQFFHSSKKYYQHAHQKGFQYIDKSVDFLGKHSKEYYNLAKENDTTRNLLVMAIYSFFLIKILGCLSSLCCRTKSAAKHSNTSSVEVDKLSGQVRVLSTQLQTLKSDIQRLNSQSEVLAQKIDDCQFPASSNGKAIKKQSIVARNGTVPDEKVNEMMSFFTDSLRDVWSQIKVIKANIRENDVSQLSFNFNPNSYRLEGAGIGKSKLSPQNEKTIQKEISEAVGYGAKSNPAKDAKKSQRNVPPVKPKSQIVQKTDQVSPTPVQASNNLAEITQAKDTPHMPSNNATQAPATQIPQPKRGVKPKVKKPIAKRPLPKMKRPGMGRKLKPVKTKKPRFLLNKKPISVIKQPVSIAEKIPEIKPQDNNIHPEETENQPKSNLVIPQGTPVQSDIITEAAPLNPNYQANNVFNTESNHVALENTQNQPFSMPMPGQVAGVPTKPITEKRESTQSNHSKQTHLSQNKRTTNFFAQSQKSEEKQNDNATEQPNPKPAMSLNSGALQTPKQSQTQRSPLTQSKAPAINEFFAPQTCPNPVAVDSSKSEPTEPALTQVQTPAPKISAILGMKNRSKIPSRRIPNRMKRGRKVPKKPIAMKKPMFKKPEGISDKPKGI